MARWLAAYRQKRRQDGGATLDFGLLTAGLPTLSGQVPAGATKRKGRDGSRPHKTEVRSHGDGSAVRFAAMGNPRDHHLASAIVHNGEDAAIPGSQSPFVFESHQFFRSGWSNIHLQTVNSLFNSGENFRRWDFQVTDRGWTEK
jgi:hypothetical protein